MKYIKLFENDNILLKKLNIVKNVTETIRKDIIDIISKDIESWAVLETIYSDDMKFQILHQSSNANNMPHPIKNIPVDIQHILVEVIDDDLHIEEFVVEFNVNIDFGFEIWCGLDEHNKKLEIINKFTKETITLFSNKYKVLGINLERYLKFDVQYDFKDTFDDLNKLYTDINI